MEARKLLLFAFIVLSSGLLAALWFSQLYDGHAIVGDAEEKGDATTQFNLGFMYANGQGVPEDDVSAYMWWNLAAEQGDTTAQYNKHSNFDHSKSASVSSRLWSIGWSMSELETNSSLCVVKGFCMPYFTKLLASE